MSTREIAMEATAHFPYHGEPHYQAHADLASPSALKRTLRSGRGEAARERAICLTPRQREVLSLLCSGLPNKLICRQLGIAAGTVKVHISVILRELGASSRLEAVVLAHRHGLDHGNEPAALAQEGQAA